MADISVNSSREKEVTDRIKELFMNIVRLDESGTSGEINLEKVNWVTPLSILPLAVKISKKIENNPELNIVYPSNEVAGYLKYMHFPNGLNEYGSYSQSASYIPIVCINLEGNSKNEGVDNAISKYASLLDNLIQDQEYKQNIQEAISYLLSEGASNVLQHSNSNRLWIFAQYWRSKNEIEICLADEGVGFKNAYQNAENPRYPKDDADAIKYALKGVSSKYGVENSERGYGIRTSLRLVTESELNGEFLIISGDACYSGMKKQFFIV